MATDYDVIVCGGGAAGTAAAIASGRSGCRTLLIEKGNCCGGAATSGLLSLLGPFDYQGQRIVKGIPEEILNRTIKAGGAVAVKPTPEDPFAFTPINHEILKFVLDSILEESGVAVLYHSLCIQAKKSGDFVQKISVANKAGLQNVSAEIYIDATGDGDLVAQAGAQWEMGTIPEGFIQPMTMVCRLGGVDEAVYKWEGNFRYQKEILEARACGDITFDVEGIGAAIFIPGLKGVLAVNMSHIFDLNPLKPSDVSKAEAIGRKQAQEILRFFRTTVAGCENAFLLDTAMQVGIRESRRIVGDYQLTLQDILEGRRFSDAIAAYGYPTDIHIKSEDKGRLRAANLQYPARYYQIPFRSLLPKSLSNLLVSGRCISTTSEALSSVRLMPCCMAIGQAAGTAAALSVKNKATPRNLSPLTLQQKLRSDGAFID